MLVVDYFACQLCRMLVVDVGVMDISCGVVGVVVVRAVVVHCPGHGHEVILQ